MKSTVFTKVFAYTMLLVLAISVAAALLFSREFLSFYRAEQRRRLAVSFAPIISVITDSEKTPEEIIVQARELVNRELVNDNLSLMLSIKENSEKSPEEIIAQAREFAEKNQSFRFFIESDDGRILYSSTNVEELLKNTGLVIDVGYNDKFTGMTRIQGEAGENPYITIIQGEALENSGMYRIWTEPVENTGMIRIQGETGEKTYTFTGFNSDADIIDVAGLVRGLLVALILMMVIAVLGSVLFAKKVTRPLEDELVRERAMEENQRLFFSAASHELKTPIAAARALVEGMIAGVGDYRDTRKYLRECLKTLDSQARLVSNILEIVKLSDKESAPGTAIAMDLSELNNTVLAEYRPLAVQRGLLIHGGFPRVSVLADRALLQRVFSNVMANAVRYTPEGGTISIASNEGKSLRVSILNTGACIPEEAIARLFEPFYRLDTARTRHATQSGMGLAIVKRALDRMKMPFALENTSEGVLFWVELPVSIKKGVENGKQELSKD